MATVPGNASGPEVPVRVGESVLIFTPDPLVTVTIEAGPDGDDIHFHGGGQGVWIARMVQRLGAPVAVCAPFGHEAGRVAASLISSEGIEVIEVALQTGSGAYVHDRRGGDRVVVAEDPPTPLGRHDLDELYGAVVVSALRATVCVLGGPGPWGRPPVPPEFYTRLATDLRSNHRLVVADLSGPALTAALAGGVDFLKVSQEDLMLEDAAAAGDPTASLRRLREAGAENVALTRGAEPALALIDGEMLQVSAPRLGAHDHRGAGDAFTAGVATGLARGHHLTDALRLGCAAGALNVTRSGLATGNRRDIQQMAARVSVSLVSGSGGEP